MAHLLGCSFYALIDYQGLHIGWAGEHHLADASLGSRYLICLYWALVTVATIGYGDIVPRTDLERLFVVGAIFVGNGIFAYMIGKVTSLAAQLNIHEQVFTEKMDSVNEFMRVHRLPRTLKDRVRDFYKSFWTRGIYFNESVILGDLTFELREEVKAFLMEV